MTPEVPNSAGYDPSISQWNGDELYCQTVQFLGNVLIGLSRPKLKKHVTVKDVIKFFVQYMKNDQLGMIANAHLGIEIGIRGG